MLNYSFAYPWFFLLLVLIPILIAWYIWKNYTNNASLQLSTLRSFKNLPRSYKEYIQHLLFVSKIICIILLIIALARPQSMNKWEEINTEGIDIVMALDISSSMLAQDFKPDRLEAAKDVATKFISGRPNDRIGLVVFSGESFTQCPLTVDHAVLTNLFNDIKCGMIEDGTAIGEGLATAVNRIKDSRSKSRVIILLTDGVNNKGEIAPLTAAEIAKTYGIRVYTIGVGTYGEAPYPFQTPFGIQYQRVPVEIDEPLLKSIADMTGGKYFRATDNKKLKQIYDEIDKMEKIKVSVKQYSKRKEEFLPFALLATLLLLIEIVVKNTILKTIP